MGNNTYTIGNSPETTKGYSLENALEKRGYTDIVARHMRYSSDLNGTYWVTAKKDGYTHMFTATWVEKYNKWLSKQ